MPLKHYPQIRSRNALAARADAPLMGGREGSRNTVKAIPDKIINHGLLAAAADAFSNPGEACVWKHIALHLIDVDLVPVDAQVSDLDSLVIHLSQDAVSSHQLRQITSEVMAWLDYARRLISPLV